MSSDFTAIGTIHSDLRAQEKEMCHSVQFSLSVMSDSLWPHGKQHSTFSPSSCHEVMGLNAMILVLVFFLIFSFKLALSLFSFCPESNVYSESISPKIDWFYLLAVQETLKSLLQQHSLKASPFNALPSLWPSGHNHWEDHSLDYTDLCRQRNVSAFQLSRFVLTLLPRSKRLLISWLQSPSAVILELKKRKSVTTSIFSPSICHKVMGLDAMIFVFLIFSFELTLSLSFFTLIKRLFSSSSLSTIRRVSSTYLRLLMFLPPILISAQHFSWSLQHID